MKTPNYYLSKREDGTYCIIANGMPANQYTTKNECILIADQKNIDLSIKIWSAAVSDWIYE